MSENAKTIVFVAAGICAIALGLVSAPKSAELDEGSLSGVNLTKDFKDPETAKKLRIVRFDEDTGATREFDVAEQEGGLWAIPSKDGYPADAAKQMAEASTSLMDRKILRVASKNAGDHEQYGVVDPLSPKLELGQKGVGTRVTMSDAQGKPLADLIIGKAVRDAEGQRYVREAGRDVVYVIEIDPSKMSTNFEDWIEKDLLKLNAWDLQQVDNKDYSAEMQLVLGPNNRPSIGVAVDSRSDITVAYSDADAKWTPVKLKEFDPKKGKDGEYVDFKLADDEELNTETLNSLKTALDDLKIVDVRRKPQGFSDNLKAGEDFMNNSEALRDLIKKGFAVMQTPGSDVLEILSSDGDVIATMKNGTEYVLRFGKLTDVEGSDDKDKDAKEEKVDAKAATPDAKEKSSDKGGVHRYLFVMARFNKDAVKQPDLVKLPELPAKQDKKADAAAAPAKDGKEGEAADAKDSKKDESAAKTEDKDAAKADETAKDKSSEKADAAKPAENADKKDKKEDAPAKGATESDKDLDKVIAERKRIEQENQRKLDDYNALLKKGEQNLKDLNLRFGDWYFVVNDDVFKKVRVGRDKIIKKKDKKEDQAAAPGGAAAPGVIPGLPAIPSGKK
jgi:hypothetical protein